jgi:Domain of unknown function (DUF4136)
VNKQPRLIAGLLTAPLALWLAGCAGTAPTVRVDKGDADLSKCQSFDWLPASQDATASLTEQRVRAATLRELEARGYTHSTDKPDCRITYRLAISEATQAKPRVGVGAAGGSGGVGGGVGISIPLGKRKQNTGTFTMDIVDVASNSQIWAGSLEAGFEGSEPTEEEAAGAVRKVLAEFPDRASPGSATQ